MPSMPTVRRPLVHPVARDRPHILVADDDPDLRVLVCRALRKRGFEVLELADGAELVECLGKFLRQVTTSPRRPTGIEALLVTDIRMPKGDGLSVVQGLRQSEWRVPVVVMSALDDSAVLDDVTRVGASAFFQKPFDPAVLALVVERLASLPKTFYDPLPTSIRSRQVSAFRGL